MKIKIMDDFVHEYEDVTRGEVYEVVEEYLMDYIIIDDQFDKNAILKEHCEIVDDRGGEPTKQALPDTLQQIIQFTQNNKGFSIEFNAGKITLADWSTDPNATFYRPKTLEELLELMELLEKINEFRDETN